jgi:hypothetical protein
MVKVGTINNAIKLYTEQNCMYIYIYQPTSERTYIIYQ